MHDVYIEGKAKDNILEAFYLIHRRIPVQGCKGQNWYHFLPSEVHCTLSKLWNINCVSCLRSWLLEEAVFFINSTRSHVTKPDTSQETGMWGAAAAPDFTNESFASLLGPNATRCSFGKLYFTIIIIQIKFRDVTGLLATLLLSPHLLVKGFYIICQKTDIFKLPPCHLSLVAWKTWRVHDGNFFERREVEFCCPATSLEFWLSD